MLAALVVVTSGVEVVLEVGAVVVVLVVGIGAGVVMTTGTTTSGLTVLRGTPAHAWKLIKDDCPADTQFGDHTSSSPVHSA